MDAERQREETEKAIKELKSRYIRLFDTDDGKEVYKDLMRFCGYNKTSVCEQAPDLNQTLYAEGKRRVFPENKPDEEGDREWMIY